MKYIKHNKKLEIKHKRLIPGQKELLNLFDDLSDIILTDKTLMSSKDENEKLKEEHENENENENENDNDNENENKNKYENEDDDYDYDYEYEDDETIDQNEIIKEKK